MTYNCVGLFCEDIREEVSGTHTIIGVMPDNINLAAQSPLPVSDTALLLPKLGIYLRLNIDTTSRPAGPITARLSFPGMPEFPMGELGQDAIKQAFDDSVSNDLPHVGIVFKAVLSPVKITEPGLASAFLKIGDTEILAATLNIQIATG